jgi:molybdopterin-guanine dinucleotide biosynthesis protein MobB
MEQLHLVTVTGLKRTGKTTVVEAIVAELHSRGHHVGTIKTMRRHPDSLFTQATDTRRHAEAGASVVVAIHADGTSRFEKGRPPQSLQEVVSLFPEDVRVLVSEGVIDSAEPQLVVLCLTEPSRLEETLETRHLSAGSVVAISGTGAPVWDQALLPGTRAFDVTDPVQKMALVDLLLERMARAERPSRKKTLPRC